MDKDDCDFCDDGNIESYTTNQNTINMEEMDINEQYQDINTQNEQDIQDIQENNTNKQIERDTLTLEDFKNLLPDSFYPDSSSWKNILQIDLSGIESIQKEDQLPIAIYSVKLIETADLFFSCIFAPFIRILKDSLLQYKNQHNTQYNKFIYQVISNIKEKSNITDETPNDNDKLSEQKIKLVIGSLKNMQKMKNETIDGFVETGITILQKIVHIQALLYTLLLPFMNKFVLYPFYLYAKTVIMFLRVYVSIFSYLINSLAKTELTNMVLDNIHKQQGLQTNKDGTKLTKEKLISVLKEKMLLIQGMIDVFDITAEMLTERSTDKLYNLLTERLELALDKVSNKCPINM